MSLKINEGALDIQKATPAQIDALLAEYGEEFGRHMARAASMRKSSKAAREGSKYERPNLAKADRLAEQAREEEFQAVQFEIKMMPLDNEFHDRGGWTRAFLVNNSNGHVHKNRSCSTCFITTEYYWLTAYSGMDEDQIVADAGERACTVCYPSAPVEVLSRATKMFTPDEQAAQAERDRRAAAKAAKESAYVLDTDGKMLFKTVRAATNDISANLGSMIAYAFEHPDNASWARSVNVVADAVEAKTGDSAEKLIAEAALRQAKKYLRENKDWKSHWMVQQSIRQGIAVKEPKFLDLSAQQLADKAIAQL